MFASTMRSCGGVNPFRIVGDSSKLRRTLGTAPKVAFETTLKVLLAHDLKQAGCQVPFPVPAT